LLQVLLNVPILILLDEMPPYFEDLATRSIGAGTVAEALAVGASDYFLSRRFRRTKSPANSFFDPITQSETNIEMAQSHAHGGIVRGSSESASCGDHILHGRRRTARSVGDDRLDSNCRPPHPDSRTALVADPPFFPDVLFESSSGFESLDTR
jgi:hypothetical protein